MRLHVILLPLFLAQPPPDPPFEVESAKPLPALTQKFTHTSGWTGGDGATSIRLNDKRTLWLFGDTWIGRVENGKRVESRMVNNTVAWQEVGEDKPLRFFWDTKEKEPAALLRPELKAEWYWPGDGAMIDGKLYLFCKVVKRKEAGAPGFQFDWFANDLLKVENPLDKPTAWQIRRCRVSRTENDVRLGVGCRAAGDYFYSLALFPSKDRKAFDSPVGLARVQCEQLAEFDGRGWKYRCQAENGPTWSDKPENLIALFRDAAPEMTIGQVRGIPGFVALYTAFGLGGDIMIRHAQNPEGPWSKPTRVYRCAESDKRIFTYAAKFHPELSTKGGQLIVTYCRNIGDLAEHVKRPDIYIPQGVEIQLKPRK
jgi:hypothetical protein